MNFQNTCRKSGLSCSGAGRRGKLAEYEAMKANLKTETKKESKKSTAKYTKQTNKKERSV